MAVGLLLLGGACLLGVLVFPGYDRARILTGRTEVVSMRLDNPAFGILSFDAAIQRADLDTPAAARGPMQLDVASGTTIRFVRIGRGPMRLNFTAAPGASPNADCAAGLRAIGTISLAGVASVLCEGASVFIPLSPGEDPLVVGMSGGLVVGEEVTEGAGPRPIMLEATTTLWVRHSGAVFRGLCGWELLEHVCDRFVANSLTLSPGNSVRAFGHLPGHGGDRRGAAVADAHGTVTPADGDVRLAGLGFIRADPNEFQSGMMFSLAAPASAFQVTRLEGEAFTIKENLFEVIKESPLMRTLNVTTLTVGLPWYFLRLRGGRGGEVAGAALICLCLAAPASAQQAMLRADETGQALLRSRGDRCYAVTPAHVMGTDTSALVTAPGRERGEGDLLRRIPAAPEPIALLSLRGVPLSLCPAFEGPVPLDALLRNRGAASLRLVRADGSIDRIPLMLAAVEVETVEVQTELGVTLEQGMSGGTVLVADQPVGLLADVLNGGRTGRVARLDRIFERLTPHLSIGSASAAVRADAAVDSVPYEILRSNAAPLAPGNKVSSLQGDGPGPWRVAAAGRVELVLKTGAPVGVVTFDMTGLDDPPAAVEILASRSETGPWQSLVSLSLEPGDAVQSRQVATRTLSYLLVRAYATGSRKTLALGRLILSPR